MVKAPEAGGARRTVGVIGVGRMGYPMTGHLIRAGFQVTVYDVQPESLDAARELGATVASSPAEVAEAADLVLVLVGYPDQADAVVRGPDGLLDAARPGLTVAMASTIGVAQVTALAEQCQSAGVDFLDAPICRGEAAAVSAELLWLVGGDDAVVDRCRPALETCGPDVFHVGAVGNGQVAKAINNMLLWTAMCADHEAFELATAYGIDVEVLRTALIGSTGTNWALENWERMAHIPWALKDMTLVLESADRVHASLPLAGVVRERAKLWQWRAGYE